MFSLKFLGGKIVDKGSIVIKTDIKALLGDLIKKIIVVLLVLGLCIVGNIVKNYVASKYKITDSIFKAEDPLGIVSMILVYIVLGILLLLFIIAVYKFFSLFYSLKRVTIIDFVREKIIVQSYDFPYEKHIEEKRFSRIVGVEILQKSIDRAVNSGTLYLEYLVLSKNDSKLRGIEIPYVLSPVKIKDRLIDDQL